MKTIIEFLIRGIATIVISAGIILLALAAIAILSKIIKWLHL